MDLRSAAGRLGVHYQTAYRWVREGALPAHKVGASYQVDEAEVQRLLARRTSPAPPRRKTAVRSWQAHVLRLHRLLLEGEERPAGQLVERLHRGGVSVLSLCEQLFSPVLLRLGEDWAVGRLSVAHEHRASVMCERLLARVAEHPRGRPRGVAVVGTPAGEAHSLPASMAALCLRADRWQVHHLGADVPVPDLTEMVADVNADVVVLSTVRSDVTATVAGLRGPLRPYDVQLLVGRAGDRLRDLVQLAGRG